MVNNQIINSSMKIHIVENITNEESSKMLSEEGLDNVLGYISTILTSAVLHRLDNDMQKLLNSDDIIGDKQYSSPIKFWESHVKHEICEDYKISFEVCNDMLANRKHLDWYCVRNYLNLLEQVFKQNFTNYPKIKKITHDVNYWYMLSLNNKLLCLEDCITLLKVHTKGLSPLIPLLNYEYDKGVFNSNKLKINEDEGNIASVDNNPLVTNSSDIAAKPYVIFKNKIIRRLKKQYKGKKIQFPKGVL